MTGVGVRDASSLPAMGREISDHAALLEAVRAMSRPFQPVIGFEGQAASLAPAASLQAAVTEISMANALLSPGGTRVMPGLSANSPTNSSGLA